MYFEKVWQQFVPPPLESVTVSWSTNPLLIYRLDLLQSWATGNKYYKLKYALQDARLQGAGTIVSKGGMFSNHLYALADACLAFNFKCICIIRSYADDTNNPTLQYLRSRNVQLIFLPPAQFDVFEKNECEVNFPDAYFISEGGQGKEGIHGAGEIIQQDQLPKNAHVFIAGGTITTALGILASAPADMTLHIVPAWKGCTNAYVEGLFKEYDIHPGCGWALHPDYHFGGFGKSNSELVTFMTDFYQQTKVLTDPVYTGKLMYAIRDLIEHNKIAPNKPIIAIHTGGLQGIAGAYYRFPDLYREYVRFIIKEN